MKGWRILLMPLLVFGLSVCLALTGCEGGGGDDDDDAPEGGGAAAGVTEEADEAETPEEEAEPEPEPEPEPALEAPTLISPDNGARFTARGGQATVELFWTTAPGATSYMVEVGGSTHSTGINTSYEFSGPPGVYNWKAIAVGNQTGSSWSEAASETRQFMIVAF